MLPAVATLALLMAATWLWRARAPVSDANTLTLTGNVDIREVSLAFNAAERVTTMRVTEGDRVHAGEVLGELDTRTTKLRLAEAQAQAEAQMQVVRRLTQGSRPEEIAQARASIVAARADAALAASQLDRLQGVRDATQGKGVSRDDLDAAQSRRQIAQARLLSARQAAALVVQGPRKEDIAQAESQLKAAQAGQALLARQLDEAQLHAPMDAVVRARLLEPGDMASPQRPAYTLAITQPKWIRTYVPEPRLRQIRPGMPATITTDGMTGSPLNGRVGYISSVAEFTPKEVQTPELRTSLVYEVRVQVDDPADSLRLGMPVTVNLKLDHAGAAASK